MSPVAALSSELGSSPWFGFGKEAGRAITAASAAISRPLGIVRLVPISTALT